MTADVWRFVPDTAGSTMPDWRQQQLVNLKLRWKLYDFDSGIYLVDDPRHHFHLVAIPEPFRTIIRNALQNQERPG